MTIVGFSNIGHDTIVWFRTLSASSGNVGDPVAQHRPSGKLISIADALAATIDAAEIEFDPLPDRTTGSGPDLD